MRRVLGLCLCLSLGACVAPADPAHEGERSLEQPIINGTRDTTRHAVITIASDQSVCSGTIVQTDPARGLGWVLTAAHCVQDNPQYILQGNDYQSATATYPVADYLAHPAYDDRSLAFDFAVIVFTGATRNTPVIPIQTAADGLRGGSAVTSVGYGRTRPADQAGGDNSIRYFINRNLSDLSDDQTLVYSLLNGGICQGDSGGPVLATYNGQERVVGVHSAVTEDCRGFGYSGRVSAVYDTWIQGQLTGELEDTCDLCRQVAQSGDGDCVGAINACFNNQTCADLVDCLNSCQTDACFNNCATQFSAGVDRYLAISTCVCEDACASQCQGDPTCPAPPSCGFQFSDQSCNSCMEGACCDQAARCADDGQCFDCLGADSAACADNAPLNDLFACLSDQCEQPCGLEVACGFSSEGACGECLADGCCTQGERCADDETCEACVRGDLTGTECEINPAYNRLFACLGECDGDPCGANEGDNNGAVNNGVNNGGNNGDPNNGAVNNGADNNGTGNNGDANNGAVNNGVNNGDPNPNNSLAEDNNGASEDGFVSRSGGRDVQTCAAAGLAPAAPAPWALLLPGAALLWRARRP
jgi:hypothetical protein